jgi:hypothetical protein
MKPNDRDFKGIWIPAELWLRKDVTFMERCFLAEIDSLDKGEGCYASDAYLGDLFQLTANRVAHIISSLRKRKLVRTISFNGRTRFLRVYYSQHKAALSETNRAPMSKRTEPLQYSKADSKETHAAASRTERAITFCAQRLEAFLRSQNKLNGKHTDLAKWKKQIGWLLRRDLGGDVSRLIRVARVYVERAHDRFTPKVHNAYQFRDKFSRIEDWVNRYEPPPAPDKVRITDHR